LEYLIQVRGGAAAAAQVRGLTGEMGKLAASQERVGASGDKATAGSGKMASAMGLVGKVAKVGSLALVAVGLEAVKMSNSFSTEMLKIRTEGGASGKEFANMRQGVLDLAASGQSLGAGPVSLAQGLYHLESMGIRGSNALLALKLSAQEAAISGANLEQTTTALGGALFINIKGTGDVTQAMASLNAIAGAGNMRFQDLNEALGTGLLGSAKLAHLSLQETGAALGVLTDAGYKASSAAAQLGTSFHFLYSPTGKAEKALATIGLSSKQLSADLQKPEGLTVALTDLQKHLHGLSNYDQQHVLNALLPGGRGRVLLNLYSMLDRIHQKYVQVLGTQGVANQAVNRSVLGHLGPAPAAGPPTGFAASVIEQALNPTTRLHMATAKLQANMVVLGDVLTKYVTPALIFLASIGAKVLAWLTAMPDHVKKVVAWFQELPGPVRTIITLVGLMAGQAILLLVLAKAFGAVKGAVELLGPAFKKLTLKKLGLMALVAVAILIVTHWKEVKTWIDHNQAAFILLVTAISPIAAAVTTAFVVSKLRLFATAITDIFPFIITLLGKIGLIATTTEATSVAGIASNARFGASFLTLLGPIGLAAGAVAGLAAAGNAAVKATGGIPNPTGSFNAGGGGGASGTSPGQTGGANIGGLHIGGPGGNLLHGIGIGATGAVVTRATRAIVGEAGPEMVVPLSKMPGASSLGGWGGGDIVVQVEGREIARALRREVIKAMAAGA